MSHERKCIVDGTIYEYCPHCGSDGSKETWKMIYCSETCREVDGILKKFKAGKYDAPATRVKLEKFHLDTTKSTTYTQPLFSALYDTIETVEEPVEEIITEEPVEEIQADVTEEKAIVENAQPKKNYKKNNKKNWGKKEFVNDDLVAAETEE